MRSLRELLIVLVVGIIAGCRPAAGQLAPATNTVQTDEAAAVLAASDTAGPTTSATNTAAPSAATPSPAATEVVLQATATPTVTPGESRDASSDGSRSTPSPAGSAAEPAGTTAPADTPFAEAAAPAATEAPPADATVIAAGLEVYKQQYCGICHQLTVANTRGAFGPSQDQMGTIALERLQDPRYHGSATSPAEYIRESIVDPNAYLVEGFAQTRHHMPAFTHLSDAELEALVQLLLSQR